MSLEHVIQDIKLLVKSHPDFPKKGIIFRDFFPILQNPRVFNDMLNVFTMYLKKNNPNVGCIAGIESRGFLLGPPLAMKLDVPFIPIRKPGKLPGEVLKEVYTLEYGSDAIEIQKDALQEGQKIIVIDDLIATGGTMGAAVKLIRKTGCTVEHCLAVIELSELKGREKIPAPVYSLFQY